MAEFKIFGDAVRSRFAEMRFYGSRSAENKKIIAALKATQFDEADAAGT